MLLKKSLRLLIAFLIGTVTGIGDVVSSDEAKNVLILANANNPDSVEIAKYYSEKRGIPEVNIIALPMSGEETISLREYVNTLHNPLLDALIEREWVFAVRAEEKDFTGRKRVSVGLHHISYLVTVLGVPLRIANDSELLDPSLELLPDQFRVNNASVDSELSLLIGPQNLSMTAFVPNPLYKGSTRKMVNAERVIRVSRLDGPDFDSVKRMIDRTLNAESEGLMGRAYFDSGGPHALGDEWIRSACELTRNAFFDTDFETTERVIDETDRFDMPAIYMGWYRHHAYGPWSLPRWPVPPGAIGFHLHSFSATTVRSESEGWLGAFVRQGYCATVGNVYEPYLEYTHRPDLLLEALLEGRTFGEAVMSSIPALSWQGVAIGDPLYRPFKIDLKTQLERAGDKPLSAYVYLREINRLKMKGEPEKTLLFAQTCYRRQPSLPLVYKLAQLYAEQGDTEKAVELLEVVRSLEVFAVDEVMLVKEIADFLIQQGNYHYALDIYKKLMDQENLSTIQKIALLNDGSKLALKAKNGRLSSQWMLTAENLKQP